MTPDGKVLIQEESQLEAHAEARDWDEIEAVDISPVWLTPGSLIAQWVASIPHVRFVAERLEGIRYAVFVVLDDDPEEVLDAIFQAEQEVMRHVPNMTFDMRVRRPHDGWKPDNLLASCMKHYARP